ncbi:DUF4885 domain-containing protein [Aliarcobacter skirrowii]|uniref:DUF4885 domain-containing protein n=1 Tax=Aliarcobacter skirrowii TaxID=28200 RepID=UPI0021B34994|nr:DUF4885 domain-containing protein [Aliarcobacter skirrowii]MCT7446569.1 DUF4885 domain-containing protein [Aliarcobacter skirrowii]
MRIDTNISQSFGSLNGAIKVTYANNISQTEHSKPINEPVKLNIGNNDTIINARLNGYVNEEIDKRDKILKEHYSKMYQENIKFESPVNHITDKYYTENSPYYIKGLTKEERNIASYTEIRHLTMKGEISEFMYDDAVLKGKKTPVFDDIMRAEENAYNREAVNNQFQTLLNKHGITIPKDEKLTFTIEPNYYTLKINGTKDENLAQAIEDILNKNSENVKQLFFHINYMKSDSSTQFTKEKEDKWNIVNSAKEFTGYNLADLEVKGDRFLAPDGTDLFRIFKNNFDERYPNPGFDKNTILIYYENQLTELARKGFENVPDLVLSIEYKNRSFYDIGQKENYGTGKTAWIEEWNIAKTSEYNAAQNKINYKSQYTENPSEFTRSINKYDLANELKDVIGYDLNDLKEENGKFLTSKGEDIFELYKKELQSKYFFSKDLQEAKSNYFGNLLKDFSKIGLNNIPNFEPKKEEDLMQILDKIEPLEIYV